MTKPLPLLALLAGLVVGGVVVAACGGTSPRGAAAPDSQVAGLDQRDPHDPRIEELDQQITADLEELGLEPPTDTELTEMMVSHATPALPMSSDIASTCDAAPPQTCSDVCTLADSICGNARSICDIAAEPEMAGDEWAAQRCAAGQESCDRAKDRCCGC